MKTQRRIFIAFILNLFFSLFEFVGGICTGSTAILSDALHDAGDGISIGISYLLERKSRKKPDDVYTYGYGRYAILAGLITTLVLLLGSFVMIGHGIFRILHPREIHYPGVILFALVGIAVNTVAVYCTHGGDSMNQKAVNLHMLEDVLGWVSVLIGACIMYFTDLSVIDPLISIGISLFIIIHGIRNLKEISDLFMEKTPKGLNVSEIKMQIEKTEGVIQVHHIHLWRIDGQRNAATMHVVTKGMGEQIKAEVRKYLAEKGVGHSTIEIETENEKCNDRECAVKESIRCGIHCHH